MESQYGWTRCVIHFHVNIVILVHHKFFMLHLFSLKLIFPSSINLRCRSWVFLLEWKNMYGFVVLQSFSCNFRLPLIAQTMLTASRWLLHCFINNYLLRFPQWVLPKRASKCFIKAAFIEYNWSPHCFHSEFISSFSLFWLIHCGIVFRIVLWMNAVYLDEFIDILLLL